MPHCTSWTLQKHQNLASVIAWIWNEVTISHVHEPADGHRWCGWAVFNCDVQLFYLASCQSTWS